MSKHLQRDLERLKKDILAMGSMVEQSVNEAMDSLDKRDADLAVEVLRSDDRLDRKEVEIEEDCLKSLALNQPVATDLRFIIAVMKVNNDLERIGDLAVNIAERAAFLSTHEPLGIPLDFERMMKKVQKMLRECLEALVTQDAILARKVCQQDDDVDELNRHMFDQLQQIMEKNPKTIERAIHLLSVSRHLERVADLATNIAEDVVFMVEGEVIRHQHEAPAKRN